MLAELNRCIEIDVGGGKLIMMAFMQPPRSLQHEGGVLLRGRCGRGDDGIGLEDWDSIVGSCRCDGLVADGLLVMFSLFWCVYTRRGDAPEGSTSLGTAQLLHGMPNREVRGRQSTWIFTAVSQQKPCLRRVNLAVSSLSSSPL